MTATQKTVGQIAAELPASIRVFEKYGIDYCCGGSQPFEDACRERGIPPASLLEEAQAAASTPGAAQDWTKASLTELIQHILSTHHEFLRAELPAIEQRLQKVLEAHGPKHSGSLLPLQQAFLGLQDEIYSHMYKEEAILFPAILNMDADAAEGRAPAPSPFGTVENPIRMMRHEHDNAASALREMRRITGDYTLPDDACATYAALYRGLAGVEADLHRHIHLENNILFPRASQLEQVG
ncbi:MAG: iron-sulfur cluster repair di-iron protein [Acidobacteriota bacterium]